MTRSLWPCIKQQAVHAHTGTSHLLEVRLYFDD